MASPMEVAILLLTACATFHFSDARGIPNAILEFNPDNDAFGVEQASGPTKTTKGCNSTSEAERRKDELDVGAYVGPQGSKTEFAKNAKLQMPYEIGENVIPTGKNPELTNKLPLRECSNFRSTVYPPTPDRESHVLKIHTEICQKLSYSPCILGDITSFELKEKDMFGDRRFYVMVNHGKIFGLSNFGANYNFTHSSLKFLLRWKNLRMLFSLTTDEEGKDDVRSVEVHIPLMLMHTHVLDSTFPRIEMSQVNEHELEFKSTHFEFPSTATEWAYKAVKHRITVFINENLRNFIYHSVLEAFKFGNDKSPLSFCQGLEKPITVYEDRTDTKSEENLVFNYS